jgi:hypothetical protein
MDFENPCCNQVQNRWFSRLLPYLGIKAIRKYTLLLLARKFFCGLTEENCVLKQSREAYICL